MTYEQAAAFCRRQYLEAIDAIGTKRERLADLETQIREVGGGEYKTKLEMECRRLESEIITICDAVKIRTKAAVDAFDTTLYESTILDGSKLTDDVKLLQSGVNVRESDLEKLAEKYKDNATMCRLLYDYAEKNLPAMNIVLKMKLRESFTFDRRPVDSLSTVCQYSDKWLPWKDYPSETPIARFWEFAENFEE